MKYLFELALLFICCYNVYADESDVGSYVFQNDNIANGEYSFRFQTPNRIEREESGSLDADQDLVVRGYYSYIDEKTGIPYYVSYYADKTGFHPFLEPKPIPNVPEIPSFPSLVPVSAPIPAGAIASLLG